MCDPVSAAIAFVGIASTAATMYTADQQPDMPPPPQLPEAPPPSKLSPEAKLPNITLGQEQSNKDKLKREKRRKSLSMAGLDLWDSVPSENGDEFLGARNVRRF